MLLYYITDRHKFPGTAAEQRRALLVKISEAARAGIDYIQLREKDLSARDFERLAREAVGVIRNQGGHTKLLINSRVDIALASGADGVHLTSTDNPPSEARNIWTIAGQINKAPIFAVSCHSADEVRSAASHGADFAVLAPIFEKQHTAIPGIGLQALRAATRQDRGPDRRVEAGDNRVCIPVVALGGVTLANAHACLAAGASGIAAIRLFQESNVQLTVDALKRDVFNEKR